MTAPLCSTRAQIVVDYEIETALERRMPKELRLLIQQFASWSSDEEDLQRDDIETRWIQHLEGRDPLFFKIAIATDLFLSLPHALPFNPEAQFRLLETQLNALYPKKMYQQKMYCHIQIHSISPLDLPRWPTRILENTTFHPYHPKGCVLAYTERYINIFSEDFPNNYLPPPQPLQKDTSLIMAPFVINQVRFCPLIVQRKSNATTIFLDAVGCHNDVYAQISFLPIPEHVTKSGPICYGNWALFCGSPNSYEYTFSYLAVNKEPSSTTLLNNESLLLYDEAMPSTIG